MKKAGVPSILVAVMLLALVVTAEAQQPKKVFRMGYLSSFDPVTDPRIQGIRQRLRELGYIARAWLYRRTEHYDRVPKF
jgi:hypothetical protein